MGKIKDTLTGKKFIERIVEECGKEIYNRIYTIYNNNISIDEIIKSSNDFNDFHEQVNKIFNDIMED